MDNKHLICIIGNPPYNIASTNNGDWIMKLLDDYKKEPGGKEKLKERNSKSINDDYVKFLRYGQHLIEENGIGILAFITPHGFLDNITFRGMRWNLLKTYDKIYIIDLHGNSRKKEVCPDGSKDVNVFDVMQGVSINIFIRTGNKSKEELAKVFHYEIYGERDFKYDFLKNNSLKTIDYKKVNNILPNSFFVKKNFEYQKTYDKGFKLNELFKTNSVGVVTARDNFTIKKSKKEIKQTIETFLSLDDETARTRFDLGKDVRDWQVNFARKDLEENYRGKEKFTKISYRPFDERWTFYSGNSRGFHCYPRKEVMQTFFKDENISLILNKTTPNKNIPYYNCFVTNRIFDIHLTGSGSYGFPLYLKNDENRNINILNDFKELNPNNPNFFFIPKDENGRHDYEKGFSLNELFCINRTGITSGGDKFIIDKDKNELLKRINNFLDNKHSEEELKNKYQLGSTYRKWIIGNKNEIRKINLQPTKISYRPFDNRYTIFSNKLLWRCRYEVMKNFSEYGNLGLVSIRSSRSKSEWKEIFVSNKIISGSTAISSLDINYYFHLYTHNKK